MKRAAGLIFLVISCVLGFLTIKGTLPFMPILGHSMEPTLRSGSLMLIQPVDPGDVKVGDIIVYNVPKMVREYYSYPPVVSHRVVEIKTVPSLGFRTKGDNTGEDPFTIRPTDIRGTVGKQIPYLGLPLLFFQSQQGLIFVIIALVLLTIFLYGGELLHGGTRLHRGIFSPVINEEKRANRALTRKIEATEKKMDTTEQALENFSLAIAEYARHLASHTSAVQSLAEASSELKRGAAEQNRVLMTLMQNMGKTPPDQGVIAPVTPSPETENPPQRSERIAPEADPALPSRLQKTCEELFQPFHGALNKPAPPGCARKYPRPARETANAAKEEGTAFERFQNRQGLTEEALDAQKKISSALDRLHQKLNKMDGQE